MPLESVPVEFASFNQALAILNRMNPTAMAIVGSYGDLGKTPDQWSDLDLIYVFNSNEIGLLVEQFIDQLGEIDGLLFTYLGVHFQFGHVISIFFRDDPLRWVDIGMMDRNFSENYLVDLPMCVQKGHIPTCGIPSYPENQMQHLAKKLLKARLRNDQLYVATCACRYIAWLQVEAKMARRDLSTPGKFALRRARDLAKRGHGEFRLEEYLSEDLPKIVDAVLDDIAKRFPEIAATP